mgnify:CR=1 FL=1
MQGYVQHSHRNRELLGRFLLRGGWPRYLLHQLRFITFFRGLQQQHPLRMGCLILPPLVHQQVPQQDDVRGGSQLLVERHSWNVRSRM